MKPDASKACNRLRASVVPVAGSSLFFDDCSEFFERFIWADDTLFVLLCNVTCGLKFTSLFSVLRHSNQYVDA